MTKLTTLLLFMALCMAGRAQSLADRLTTELKVSRTVADSVLGLIDQSRTDLGLVFRNKTLTPEERKQEMKQISEKRDKKISQMLTPQQMERLKEIIKPKKKPAAQS